MSFLRVAFHLLVSSQQQGLVLDRIHYVRAIALCHGD